MNSEEVGYFWLAFGFAGQAMFTARFLVQWLKSEKEGRSVVPLAFWYLSLAGSTLLLIYACYRQDPVFMVGQSTGSFIYLRNLYLIQKEKADRANPTASPLPGGVRPR